MILKCYPRCECGYTIEKLVSWTETIEVSENHSKIVRKFNPSNCPWCGKEIEKIELPKEDYFGKIKFE